MENFIKLKTQSTLKNSLLNFAESNKNWIHRNAFDLIVVPLYLVKDDPVVGKMVNHFNVKPVIFKMKPWQFYKFHVDAVRNCALNLFLSGEDSQTYYGEPTEDEEIMNIVELVYDPDCYYLLNTKTKHAVVNRNNVRYMFSLGFDSTVEYQTVRTFCLENIQ